jgi:murein DD-endopeptidase MepM/ murein hydrolase activator NlpD
MPTFPLASRPALSYRTDGRRFGAERSGGRLHAGCDLIVPEDTPIYAVADGRVTLGPYAFHHGTDAIEFTLDDGRIVRYCEIKRAADGITRGVRVEEGQLIAYVGKMYVESMLHFELYDGSGSGGLTLRNNPPYQRRRDLVNPTSFLDSCTLRA